METLTHGNCISKQGHQLCHTCQHLSATDGSIGGNCISKRASNCVKFADIFSLLGFITIDGNTHLWQIALAREPPIASPSRNIFLQLMEAFTHGHSISKRATDQNTPTMTKLPSAHSPKLLLRDAARHLRLIISAAEVVHSPNPRGGVVENVTDPQVHSIKCVVVGRRIHNCTAV